MTHSKFRTTGVCQDESISADEQVAKILIFCPVRDLSLEQCPSHRSYKLLCNFRRQILDAWNQCFPDIFQQHSATQDSTHFWVFGLTSIVRAICMTDAETRIQVRRDAEQKIITVCTMSKESTDPRFKAKYRPKVLARINVYRIVCDVYRHTSAPYHTPLSTKNNLQHSVSHALHGPVHEPTFSLEWETTCVHSEKFANQVHTSWS